MRDEPYHHFGKRRHPKDYRKEKVEQLKQAIRATENRLVLSMPDAGLSNLIRFLVTGTNWGERKPIFAYLDCDALDDCLNREMFFAEIARQFYEQGVGNRLEAEVEGYHRLLRLLRQVGGERLSEPPLVVVVNKADRMLMDADEAFYRKLKVLADDNTRVCYIFAAGLCAANVVDPLEPLFAGRWLIVGPFNERDFAGAVIEEAQRLEVTFDLAAQRQLARLTAGHPGLLRAVSSAVVREQLDLVSSETGLIAPLLTQGDVQARCQRIWDVLNPKQQAALKFLTEERPDSVEAETLAWLRDFDLIEGHEGEYRLLSPLFQQFVAIQEILFEPMTPEKPSEPTKSEIPPDPEALLESIRIDKPTTISRNEQEITVAGKVFKGDQEVYVSSLELRLIACLKRERKIYTKDDIAKYVYYEEYEDKEGSLSDYRIDNLVRQVRQRLGYHYIKTHRGRGYEFLG